MVSLKIFNILTLTPRFFITLTFFFGRLCVKTSLFELNQEPISLTLFLELAQGFIKAIFLCHFDF